MQTKAFIMVPFLLLFTAMIALLGNISTDVFIQNTELKQSIRVDSFSLLEIETISRIKKEFLSFEPNDFTYEAGEWIISVRFGEETAEIEYVGPETVSAQLDYDMVMENVLDYRIIDSSLSDTD